MSFISPGNNFLHGRTTLHNLSLHESLNQPRAPIKWQCFSPFLKKRQYQYLTIRKTRDIKFHWFMASLHCKCLSVNNYLTFVVALENIRIITVMWRWIQPVFSLTLSKCTLQISFLYTSHEPLSMHIVRCLKIQHLFLTWLIHKVPKKRQLASFDHAKH